MTELIFEIFSNKKTSLLTLLLLVVVFVLFFIFSEIQLFIAVLNGDFPVSLLATILPQLFQAFIFESGYVKVLNYLVTSLLFAVYLTLLFKIYTNKYFSFLSIPTSILSLLGIGLGISCLSCGVVGGLLLLSLVGLGSSTFLLSIDTQLYILMSQVMMVISITIALLTLKKLPRKKRYKSNALG